MPAVIGVTAKSPKKSGSMSFELAVVYTFLICWNVIQHGAPMVPPSASDLGDSSVAKSSDGWTSAIGQVVSFTCHICGAVMKYRRSLWAHQVKFHGRPKKKALKEWSQFDGNP